MLTGPNDTGKTTVLQAIASWVLAYCRWRNVGDLRRLFGCRLLPPDASHAAHILAEYVKDGQDVPLDIASAGSGLRQVLLLLSLVHTRPGAVLLLDEPSAHLHPTLQSAVYRELKSTATPKGSRIIAAAAPDRRIVME